MAKTNEFEIYVQTAADTTADNTVLDLTDYVDIADNEAFEIHDIALVMDPTESYPAAGTQYLFQLMDQNNGGFVSHVNRSSLYISRQIFEVEAGSGDPAGITEQTSFSTLTPLIVSKTLYLRNEASAGASTNFTMRLKGKIVKPSAKDYMALVLTQTGNVGA